jgi:hypothetical protein
MPSLVEVGKILVKVRREAVRYYELTSKPLGVTGEIAEYEATRILRLKLTDARQPGWDATRGKKKIQIKGRWLTPSSKPGQRLGTIRLDHEWDSVVLILLDEKCRPFEIHEALRPEIEVELTRPGSKARNERGQLGVSKFKSIGKCVWSSKV